MLRASGGSLLEPRGPFSGTVLDGSWTVPAMSICFFSFFWHGPGGRTMGEAGSVEVDSRPTTVQRHVQRTPMMQLGRDRWSTCQILSLATVRRVARHPPCWRLALQLSLHHLCTISTSLGISLLLHSALFLPSAVSFEPKCGSNLACPYLWSWVWTMLIHGPYKKVRFPALPRMAPDAMQLQNPKRERLKET